VPLWTFVGHALVILAIAAIHMLTAAIFLLFTETDDDDRGTTTEIPWRFLWPRNPCVHYALAICQNNTGSGHKGCSGQYVQVCLSAFLSIDTIVGPADDMRLNRWTKIFVVQVPSVSSQGQ
jgi:hypothetical protein